MRMSFACLSISTHLNPLTGTMMLYCQVLTKSTRTCHSENYVLNSEHAATSTKAQSFEELEKNDSRGVERAESLPAPL